MATFRLQVVSMDGLEYDGEVQQIKLRTIHGDLAILARHMNYVTAIGMGTAKVVMADGTERQAACIGGMLSMMDNPLPRHSHDMGVGRRYRRGESYGRQEEGGKEACAVQFGQDQQDQGGSEAL